MISTMRWTASAADALWCSYALQFHLQLRIARYLWHQNAPPCTNPAKQEAMPSKAWLPVFEPGCRAAAPAGCAEGSAPARSPEAERSGPRHFAGFRRKTESVIVGSYTFAESAVPPRHPAPQTQLTTPTQERRRFHGKKRRRGSHHCPQPAQNGKQHRRRRSSQRAPESLLPERGYRPRTQPPEHPLQDAFRQLSGDVPADGAGRHHLHPRP